jgi:hypothetical protein
VWFRIFSVCVCACVCVCVCVFLRIEPRASQMLGKCFNTKLHSLPTLDSRASHMLNICSATKLHPPALESFWFNIYMKFFYMWVGLCWNILTSDNFNNLDGHHTITAYLERKQTFTGLKTLFTLCKVLMSQPVNSMSKHHRNKKIFKLWTQKKRKSSALALQSQK